MWWRVKDHKPKRFHKALYQHRCGGCPSEGEFETVWLPVEGEGYYLTSTVVQCAHTSKHLYLVTSPM